LMSNARQDFLMYQANQMSAIFSNQRGKFIDY